MRRLLATVIALLVCIGGPAHAGHVYWTDTLFDTVERATLDGADVEVMKRTLTTPLGIAVHPQQGKIYWTEPFIPWLNGIFRMNLDGSEVESVVAGGVTMRGITIDRESNLYFSIGRTVGSGCVMRMPTDPPSWDSWEMVVQDYAVGFPMDIDVDLVNRKVYWVEQLPGAEFGSLRRAGLDGADLELLVQPVVEPHGIAVDLSTGKVYWTEATALPGDDVPENTGRVRRANLDGTAVEDLFVTAPLLKGIDLDLGRGKVYWAQSMLGLIQRANLDGSDVEDVVPGLGFPAALTLTVPADALGALSESLRTLDLMREECPDDRLVAPLEHVLEKLQGAVATIEQDPGNGSDTIEPVSNAVATLEALLDQQLIGCEQRALALTEEITSSGRWLAVEALVEGIRACADEATMAGAREHLREGDLLRRSQPRTRALESYGRAIGLARQLGAACAADDGEVLRPLLPR